MTEAARVWIVSAEVKGNFDGRTPSDVGGAFVDCFVAADFIENALAAARRALQEDGYEVLDVSRCCRFEPDEWDDGNDTDGEVRKNAADVATDQATRYSAFHAYPRED